MVKKKACVFISGTGSNLKSLIRYSREYNFPVNISCVISSTLNAKGLNYAKLYKIPYYVLNLNNQLNLAVVLQKLKKKKNFINMSCGLYENFKKKFY